MVFYCHSMHEVPGVIGTLQALEAIKIVVGVNCILLEKHSTIRRIFQ